LIGLVVRDDSRAVWAN